MAQSAATSPAGTACTSNAECSSGRCSPVPACAAGTCLAPVGIGRSCVSDADCAAGLACYSGSCEAEGGQLGDFCSQARPCVVPFFCGSDQLCAPPLALGERCETFLSQLPFVGALLERLNPDPCEAVCGTDPSTGFRECVAGVGVGEACRARTNPCARGLRCNSGTCSEVVGPAEPCAAGQVCPFNFVCAAGTCQPKPGLGESCNTELTCTEGACVAGTCTLQPNGAACTTNSECVNRCNTPLGTCGNLLANGATCFSDDDCINRCVGTTCAPYLSNGSTCTQQGECLTSSYCAVDVCQACP